MVTLKPQVVVPGPCTITFKSIALGCTESGVIIQPTNYYQPIQSDQHGSAPAGQIVTGHSCIVNCVLQPRATGATGAWTFASFDILEGLFGKTGTATPKIGTLASAIAQQLDITEKDGSTKWTAKKAFLRHPGQLALLSSKEISVPLTWIILPDDDDLLFSLVPVYIA